MRPGEQKATPFAGLPSAVGVFQPIKKTPRERGVLQSLDRFRSYLEIERLNIRSIFSLVASTADWAA